MTKQETKVLIRVTSDCDMEVLASIIVDWGLERVPPGRWLAEYLSGIRMVRSNEPAGDDDTVCGADELAAALVCALKTRCPGALAVYLISPRGHAIDDTIAAADEADAILGYRVHCDYDSELSGVRILLDGCATFGPCAFATAFDSKGGGLTEEHETMLSGTDEWALKRDWKAVVHVVDGTMGLTAIRVNWYGRRETLWQQLKGYLEDCRTGGMSPNQKGHSVLGADDLAATVVWLLRSECEKGDAPFAVRLMYPEGNATMTQLALEAGLEGVDQVFRIEPHAPEKEMIRMDTRFRSSSPDVVVYYDGKGGSWRPGCERPAACES